MLAGSTGVFEASDENPMTPAKAHDLFNIVGTSALTALTVASHVVHSSWNLPLAIVLSIYLVLDSIWLALQPEVAGGTEGGGAVTLLGHHVAALAIALHAATWALHTQYTCWMTVVEINTLVLMIERQLADGVLKAVANKIFIASWVATRLLWFPILSVRFSIMAGYPSLARRLVCAACLAFLTVLQGLWTWNFLVPAERQITLY